MESSETRIQNLHLIRTEEGLSLDKLSREKQIMLVFLRHFGCIFCQEAMKDISAQRELKKKNGTEIVLGMIHYPCYNLTLTAEKGSGEHAGAEGAKPRRD